MGKSTKKPKTISLPKVELPSDSEKRKTLPYNGVPVTEKSFSFSFASFDRTHELFNLGGKGEDGVIEGKWFIDLLECLRDVCNSRVYDLKNSMHDLHPIDWSKSNTDPPKNFEQYEYWQFRLNKSRGRVIGFKLENVFYILWLDPYHNLTDSEGYGGVKTYPKPMSEYEQLQTKIQDQKKKIEELEKENAVAFELLGEDRPCAK